VAYANVWLSLIKRFCFLVSKWYWLQSCWVYMCQQKTSLFFLSSHSHCQGIVVLTSVGKSGSSPRSYHHHFWLFAIFLNLLGGDWWTESRALPQLNLRVVDGLSSRKGSYKSYTPLHVLLCEMNALLRYCVCSFISEFKHLVEIQRESWGKFCHDHLNFRSHIGRVSRECLMLGHSSCLLHPFQFYQSCDMINPP
jgi:hypothetical protein